MAEYANPADPKEGLFSFSGFRGLRNNIASDAFSPEDLEVALNVDIDDSLAVGRRKGYSAPVTSGVDRDLWAEGSVCLGVGSNALKYINPDYTTTTLRSGLTANKFLSYAPVGDRVFWSNGSENGCVQGAVNRTWGLVVPSMPVAAATGGALAAGLYQCVVTYLREDGQESGAGKAVTIELTTIGGIALSALSVSADPTVTHKAIYATSVGGETLYRVGIILNAVTTFLIDEVHTGASLILTQFLTSPPVGGAIGYWKGWMLVAKEAHLYPSEPFAPELFDLRRAVPFLDRITMVAPVRDGIWIGTNSQVTWVAGDSPETWLYRVVAQYGVVPGTLTYGDGELLGDGQGAGEPAAFFASKRGLCVGRVGGVFANLTESRFAYPIQDRGGAVVRRHRGVAQMVVTMQGTEVAGNVAA